MHRLAGLFLDLPPDRNLLHRSDHPYLSPQLPEKTACLQEYRPINGSIQAQIHQQVLVFLQGIPGFLIDEHRWNIENLCYHGLQALASHKALSLDLSGDPVRLRIRSKRKDMTILHGGHHEGRMRGSVDPGPGKELAQGRHQAYLHGGMQALIHLVQEEQKFLIHGRHGWIFPADRLQAQQEIDQPRKGASHPFPQVFQRDNAPVEEHRWGMPVQLKAKANLPAKNTRKRLLDPPERPRLRLGSGL